MFYTLHQLKIFVKTCELESITKASEELHLTQPAVSIQLKKLQEQFEIPLMEVIGRKLFITEFGREIEALSKELLAKADEIKTTTENYKGILSGEIKISSVSTAKYVIPYFLTDFFSQHSGLELNIDVTNKEKVVDSLRENQTDFAIVSVLPDNISLETLSLMPNELHLVASKKYLDNSPKISLKKLKDHPMVFRENGSATKAAMIQFLNKNQIQAKRSITMMSNEAVKQAVRAGLGISIMPKIGIRSELNNGSMALVPVKGLPIKTQWYLVWPKGKKLSPAALELIQHIKEHKEQVIQENFQFD